MNTTANQPVQCISKPPYDVSGLVTLTCPTCGKETYVGLDDYMRKQDLVIVKNDVCSCTEYFFLKPKEHWIE